MAIDPDLLKMLVCPETHRPLRLADATELASLNEQVRSGQAQTRGGEPVTEEVEAGLVPDGGGWVYPIRDDIPILLRHEAIPLPGVEAGRADPKQG